MCDHDPHHLTGVCMDPLETGGGPGNQLPALLALPLAFVLVTATLGLLLLGAGLYLRAASGEAARAPLATGSPALAALLANPGETLLAGLIALALLRAAWLRLAGLARR